MTPSIVISSFSKKSFYLPNSVDILSNGDILICDGGNDRICLFSSKGFEKKEIGKKGLGKFRFKEPVGAFKLFNDEIYVLDWHNHRIVIFNKFLDYVSEFGFLSKNISNKFSIYIFLRDFFSELKFCLFNGYYIDLHFNNRKVFKNKYVDLYTFIISFIYLIKNKIKFLTRRKYSEYGFNKPNGITHDKKNIIITQKKNKCISIHRKKFPYDRVLNIKDKRLGKLGNICNINDNFFICDESNNKIWILDKDYNFINKMDEDNLNLQQFYPFSCCPVGGNHLAVTSISKFYIINIVRFEVIYSSENFEELHGVSYCEKNKMIYVCDRAKSIILGFYLKNIIKILS